MENNKLTIGTFVKTNANGTSFRNGRIEEIKTHKFPFGDYTMVRVSLEGNKDVWINSRYLKEE